MYYLIFFKTWFYSAQFLPTIGGRITCHYGQLINSVTSSRWWVVPAYICRQLVAPGLQLTLTRHEVAATFSFPLVAVGLSLSLYLSPSPSLPPSVPPSVRPSGPSPFVHHMPSLTLNITYCSNCLHYGTHELSNCQWHKQAQLTTHTASCQPFLWLGTY